MFWPSRVAASALSAVFGLAASHSLVTPKPERPQGSAASLRLVSALKPLASMSAWSATSTTAAWQAPPSRAAMRALWPPISVMTTSAGVRPRAWRDRIEEPCDVPPKVEMATHLPRRSSAVLMSGAAIRLSDRMIALVPRM